MEEYYMLKYTVRYCILFLILAFQVATVGCAYTPQSNFDTGNKYFYGQGTFTQDYKSAAYWYGKAAIEGHAGAQFMLGSMYYEGKSGAVYYARTISGGSATEIRGVPKDEAKGLELIHKAAEQGHAGAQAWLGDLSARNGNKDEAITWWSKAAEQGNRNAKLKLDLEENKKEAAEQFAATQKLAEQGNVVEQYNLGVMYEKGQVGAPNRVKAEEWYLKAAKQGHALAQNNLGSLYAKGFGGVPKNEAKAVEWFQKAAEQGEAVAQYNLGVIYYQGQEILQDRKKACLMWSLAGKQGHKDAIMHYNKNCQ